MSRHPYYSAPQQHLPPLRAPTCHLHIVWNEKKGSTKLDYYILFKEVLRSNGGYFKTKNEYAINSYWILGHSSNTIYSGKVPIAVLNNPELLVDYGPRDDYGRVTRSDIPIADRLMKFHATQKGKHSELEDIDILVKFVRELEKEGHIRDIEDRTLNALSPVGSRGNSSKAGPSSNKEPCSSSKTSTHSGQPSSRPKEGKKKL